MAPGGSAVVPDPEALDATIYTLRLTLEAVPARWSEDTADELLTLVQIIFHDFVVAVLADPLASGVPEDGRPLATCAAIHARAICDLLTAQAVAYWKDTGDELSEIGRAEAPPALTRQRIDTIAEASHVDDRPQHETAVEYVRGAASSLSLAARVLRAERGLSSDPSDPRGPIEPSDDVLTSEDAGAILIWCATAALCIAATLQPDFRVRASA